MKIELIKDLIKKRIKERSQFTCDLRKYTSASNYVKNEGIMDACVASEPIIDFTKQNSIIEINE